MNRKKINKKQVINYICIFISRNIFIHFVCVLQFLRFHFSMVFFSVIYMQNLMPFYSVLFIFDLRSDCWLLIFEFCHQSILLNCPCFWLAACYIIFQFFWFGNFLVGVTPSFLSVDNSWMAFDFMILVFLISRRTIQ